MKAPKQKPGTGGPASPAPHVFVPTIRIPNADGSILIKPGKPVVSSPMIWAAEAAKMLGLSPRTIQYQCSVGLFETAWKPGGRPGSKWRLSLDEVLARRDAPAD